MRKSLEGLNIIIKVILIIVYDLYGFLIRIVRSLEKNNIIGVILAIVLFLFLGWIMLFVDLIFVLMGKEVWWID